MPCSRSGAELVQSRRLYTVPVAVEQVLDLTVAADLAAVGLTEADLLSVGPVVLFFYPVASSGGCTREMCTVRDRADEFTAVGAQRIGISQDTVEQQKAFADTNGFDHPLLADVDGTVCTAYDVQRKLAAAPVKRHTVAIGANGVVADVIRSEFRFSAHAAKALQALSAA